MKTLRKGGINSCPQNIKIIIIIKTVYILTKIQVKANITLFFLILRLCVLILFLIKFRRNDF